MTMSDDHQNRSASADTVFERLVTHYYEGLYRFAFSLTRSEADASDLTQQTFYIWATKGNQLRDVSKVKTWLFTTLHRMFLQIRRRESRFPHCELDQAEAELPCIPPTRINQLDSANVLQALAPENLDEPQCRRTDGKETVQARSNQPLPARAASKARTLLQSGAGLLNIKAQICDGKQAGALMTNAPP